MKINDAHNSWAKYSKTINDFVIRSTISTKKPKTFFKKLRPYEPFCAWPSCPKRHISALSGYTLAPHLDLKPVEQFLKRHARSEPLLRWHGPALEKAVAIKRMASLMHETIVVMKSLTLIQATYHKG
jgi:hypothetical protein